MSLLEKEPMQIKTKPTLRKKLLTILFAFLLPALLLSAAPTGTATAAPKRPRVLVCRMVHGVKVCFYVNGGSGITPPIFSTDNR